MSASFIDGEPESKYEAMPEVDQYFLCLHDDRTEQAVLACALYDPVAADFVCSRVKPDYFYRAHHKYIAECLLETRAKGKPVDLLTVAHEMRQKAKPEAPFQSYRKDAPSLLEACGGPEYLIAIIKDVPTTTHVNAYILQLLDLYEKRMAYAVQMGVYGDQTISEIMQRLQAVRDELDWQGGAKGIADYAVMESIEKHVSRRSFDHSNPHFDIDHLDRKSGGMPCPGYVVVMGDSGIGKTALALQIAHHWSCGHGRPALYFTLEMDPETQLIPRLAHLECGKGASTEEELYSAATHIMVSPLIIDGTTRSIEQVVAESNRLSRDPSPRLILVDYVGLVQVGRRMDERERLQHISRELKALSKEVGATVVSLSQVTWDQDRRDSSTFGARGSEFDADMVVEVRRPGATAFERRQSDEAEVFIRKNRNGQVASVNVAFMGLRFREKEPGEQTRAEKDGYWWTEGSSG